jgi:hypothetical protein
MVDLQNTPHCLSRKPLHQGVLVIAPTKGAKHLFADLYDPYIKRTVYMPRDNGNDVHMHPVLLLLLLHP